MPTTPTPLVNRLVERVPTQRFTPERGRGLEAPAIKRAINAIRNGDMITICGGSDDATGAVVMAAQFATAERLAQLGARARGAIRLALTGNRCDQLGRGSTGRRPGNGRDDELTFSVRARDADTDGTARGLARAIQLAIGPQDGLGALIRPGHVGVVRVRAGGVLKHAADAEAAVDLARIAGLTPASVACRILEEDGSAMMVPRLVAFAARNQLPVITVGDLIAHRFRTEVQLERVTSAMLPTPFGVMTAIGYRSLTTGAEHLALVRGSLRGSVHAPVRLHNRCLPGDVFGSLSCACHAELESASQEIASRGVGAVIYLPQRKPEGGPLGSVHSNATSGGLSVGRRGRWQDPGPQLSRGDLGIAAQILADLAPDSIRLLGGDSRLARRLRAFGIRVAEGTLGARAVGVGARRG